MRHFEISENQQIINKINAGEDFTYPSVKKGFVVATNTLHKSVNPSFYYDDKYRDVWTFVDNSHFLPDLTIGMWTDPFGMKFVELGVVIQDFDYAINLAKRLEQVEIWDAKGKKCITVKDY